MLFLTAVGAISGLTFILATALVLANRKLYVYEDPRIDVVEEMLPHANCGACGFPGCRPFAEALTTGEALPGKCTVSSGEETSGDRELPGRRRGGRGEDRGATGVRGRHQRGPQPRHVPRPPNLPVRRSSGRRRQRLLLGLPRSRRLRRGLRLRRHTHERTQPAGGGRGEVHRMRGLRRGLPQGLCSPSTRRVIACGSPVAPRRPATRSWRTVRWPAPPALAARWTLPQVSSA